jgi:peptide/nickel transport system substrate-binding protein
MKERFEMVRRKESHRWRLRVGAGVAAVACLGTMAAANASVRAARAKPALHVGTLATFSSFDPFLENDYGPGTRFVWEGLVIQQPDGTKTPGLATSWGFIKGHQNKEFAITLRQGVRFADGLPLDAKAAKKWFDYVNAQNIKQSGAGGARNTWGVPVSSVQVTGKYTLVIHLKTPDPGGIWDSIAGSAGFSTGAIASPRCVANPKLFNKGKCSAGAYEYDPSRTILNDHVTMVPNPYFWDKSEQRWSVITEKLITDQASGLQAMEAGQLDVLNGDYSTVTAAKRAGFYVTKSH